MCCQHFWPQFLPLSCQRSVLRRIKQCKTNILKNGSFSLQIIFWKKNKSKPGCSLIPFSTISPIGFQAAWCCFRRNKHKAWSYKRSARNPTFWDAIWNLLRASSHLPSWCSNDHGLFYVIECSWRTYYNEKQIWPPYKAGIQDLSQYPDHLLHICPPGSLQQLSHLAHT